MVTRREDFLTTAQFIRIMDNPSNYLMSEYFIMRDGSVISRRYAEENKGRIIEAILDAYDDGYCEDDAWLPVCCDINWESDYLTCDGDCQGIVPVYGSDDGEIEMEG